MKKLLYIVITSIILSACVAIKPNDRSASVSEKMRVAEDFFAKEKYRKASEYYETIVFERSAGFTSKAQMRLADCYFEQDEWMVARLEYEELTKLFPDYPEVDKAYYRIGLCSYNESLNPQYTQEETIKSAEAFERFIDKFPNNEKRDKAIEYIRNCHIKLIHKSYYNGYIYYKLKDYSSAELYLKEVIESQLHDEYEKKSYYYLAKIYKFWNDDYMLKQIMGEFEKYFADSAIFKKLANQ